MQERDEDVTALRRHLDFSPPEDDRVVAFSGSLNVLDGRIESDKVTVLHSRSIAEDVVVALDGVPYTGRLEISEGLPVNGELDFSGRSLLHSVALTAAAFEHSWFGEWGQYVVSIGLLMFAFSTAIAWSYYGDRAITYLVGARWVMPYRVVYVVGFFVAAIADTSLVWKISAITLALMTLPNLLGLVMMSGEIKTTVTEYWDDHKQQHQS